MVGLVGLLHARTRSARSCCCRWPGGLFLVTIGHLGAVEGWFAGDAPIGCWTVRSRRSATCTSSTWSSGCRWCSGWRGDRVAVRARATSAVDIGGRSLRWRNHSRSSESPCSVWSASASRSRSAGSRRRMPMLGTPAYWRRPPTGWRTTRRHGGPALPGASSQTTSGALRATSRCSARRTRAGRSATSIPLAPPGNIRMLDAVEARMVAGTGIAGLRGYLRRAGVQYVVVRNDLQRPDDVPHPVVVHQACAHPGLSRGRDVRPGCRRWRDVSDAEDGAGRGQRRLAGRRTPPSRSSRCPADVDHAVTAGVLPTVVGGPEDLARPGRPRPPGHEPVRLAADLDPGRGRSRRRPWC